MNVDNRYVAQDRDGHLPLAVDEIWQNTPYLSDEVRDDIGVTHLTFVRNALDKLVSGTSYKTSNATVEDVVRTLFVSKIRSDVENFWLDGRYQNKYAEYYLTPYLTSQQKRQCAERNIILSAEESANGQPAQEQCHCWCDRAHVQLFASFANPD